MELPQDMKSIIFDEAVLLVRTKDVELTEAIEKVGKRYGYKLTFSNIEEIIDTIPLV